MAYLVDHDYLINALAGKPATLHILKRLAPYRLALSIVSFGEIYHGAFTSTNPQAYIASFRHLVAPFRVVSVNEPIMELFGEIRAYLQKRGEIISDFDMVIGATALYYKLTLLTKNLRHFDRISKLMPELQLYKPN
jgi:tRNA(fMet)-specific endonuclease VapC